MRKAQPKNTPNGPFRCSILPYELRNRLRKAVGTIRNGVTFGTPGGQ